MDHDLEPMIEKYRLELLEYSRNYPKFTNTQEELSPVHSKYTIPQEPVMEELTEDTEAVPVLAQTQSEDSVTVGKGVPSERRGNQDNEKENSISESSLDNPPYNNGSVLEYKTKEAFLDRNTKNGYLRVQVSVAQQAFPVQNAEIVVTKRFENQESVFYEEHTDASGIVNRIALPAPDRSLSVSPTALQPYSTYDIAVSHPGYATTYYKNCAIFDGIETIQLVVLVPLSDQNDNQVIVRNEEEEQ